MGAGWKRYWDTTRAAAYYHHAASNLTQWTAPAAHQLAPLHQMASSIVPEPAAAAAAAAAAAPTELEVAGNDTVAMSEPASSPVQSAVAAAGLQWPQLPAQPAPHQRLPGITPATNVPAAVELTTDASRIEQAVRSVLQREPGNSAKSIAAEVRTMPGLEHLKTKDIKEEATRQKAAGTQSGLDLLLGGTPAAASSASSSAVLVRDTVHASCTYQ